VARPWSNPEFESLPPLDARLIDPRHDKIETPVDERGLIDVPELIRSVQETIDPDYYWPDSLSIHHFYWPEADYPFDKTVHTRSNPAVFRNLALHKGLLPRAFENWLHIVTLPPPIPSPEVMQYRVEAWEVAKSLFGSVQKAVQWERMARRRALYVQQNPDVLQEDFNGVDIIGEEIIQEVLDRHFRGAQHQVERLERIPPEFRLFNPSQSRQVLATQLGQLVVPRQLKPQIQTGKKHALAA
jgi:hypothetical protein